jgi:hypothetical protein
MKIISRYKDYYDSAQQYGVEPFVYVRNSEEQWLESSELDESVSIGYCHMDGERLVFARRITLFCGKVYPSLELDVGEQFGKKERHTFFSFEDADKVITSLISKSKRALENYGRSSSADRYTFIDRGLSRDRLRKFFAITDVGVNVDDLHFKYKSPVISYGLTSIFSFYFDDDGRDHHERLLKPDDSRISLGRRPHGMKVLRCINPILAMYDFQKVMPPYEANQELAMYVGGVLSNVEDNMVQIDDISMRQAKGFDDMSFKKAPSKRKSKK